MATREIRYARRARNFGFVEDTVRRRKSQVIYSESAAFPTSFPIPTSALRKPTYQRLQVRNPAALDKRAVHLALNAALKGHARLAAERRVVARDVRPVRALQHVAAAHGAGRRGRGEDGGCGRGEEGEGEGEEEEEHW